MTVRWWRHGWVVLMVMFGCARPAGTPAPVRPPPIAPRAEVAIPVTVIPAAGITGRQRINLGVPMPPGLLGDPAFVRVIVAGVERPAARRALARHPDGTLRSVQVQFDLELDAGVDVGQRPGVAVGADAAPSVVISIGPRRGVDGPAMVAVAETVVGDGTPRVWALLPATWLAASGVAGPLVAREVVVGTPLDAWLRHCDPRRWGTDAFAAGRDNKQAWLFDRVTAMIRSHVITGERVPLEVAYRELAIYRAGITVDAGVATTIPVPGASDDLKYHYTQGFALHYLLTGDDRSRELAEAVALRVAMLWPDTRYDGSDRFWTERHAGFALLAYEWAALVSDDRAAALAALAAAVVDAALAIQARAPGSARDGRCFAHTAAAHQEPFGYLGCSPWMSAILADGLDAHARRVGGPRGARVRQALVELGRSIAGHGRDSTGKPLYFMGAGIRRGEIDPYEEHWGEAAYLVAMAWHWSGRRDPGLRRVADELVAGLRSRGVVGHIRSFNWQCRSAVMAPAFLVERRRD